MPAWRRRTHHSDPTVGRFTSQDSFLGDIDAPPSLHRYFYGHANPLRYVDPDGHQALGTLARERGRGEFSGLQSAAEVQSAGAKPSDLDPRLDPDSAEHDPTAVALEEGLEYVEEHGLRGVPGVVYEPTPANKPSLLSRTMRRADDVLSYAGRKAREKTEEFGGAVLREPLGANKPKPPLTPEDIAWAQHSAGDQRLKTRLQDVPAGLAEGAAHGAAIGVKVVVDVAQAKATGRGLEAIADEAKAVRASRAAARNAKVAVAPNKGVATTPWGTRDLASGKYSKGPRGGLDPVDDFIAKAEANGFEVVGREVTFDTPFGQRRPDVLLRDLRTGKIQGVEIKSSPKEFARFNAQQQAADRFINRWGAKAAGDKAKDLGVGRIEGISKILWEVQ